ncbi:hypothetical protein [Pseudomonas abyssi]|uniref:hypothetical protein n=1 Tax=Pseudomonas abyssi TaxID=170540 RepID=UPI003C7E008F
MQFTVTINQAKALEWGLNAQQALLLAFIHEASGPRNSRPVAIDKHDIVRELPILTDKPDTAYRLLKQLETAGVVRLESQPKTTVVRFTEAYLRRSQP